MIMTRLKTLIDTSLLPSLDSISVILKNADYEQSKTSAIQLEADTASDVLAESLKMLPQSLHALEGNLQSITADTEAVQSTFDRFELIRANVATLPETVIGSLKEVTATSQESGYGNLPEDAIVPSIE